MQNYVEKSAGFPQLSTVLKGDRKEPWKSAWFFHTSPQVLHRFSSGFTQGFPQNQPKRRSFIDSTADLTDSSASMSDLILSIECEMVV